MNKYTDIKSMFEENIKNWRKDFEKSFKTSFKDEDLFNSCVNWIDTLMIETDCYFDFLIKETFDNLKNNKKIIKAAKE